MHQGRSEPVGPKWRKIDHGRQPGQHLGNDLAGNRARDQSLVPVAERVDNIGCAPCPIQRLTSPSRKFLNMGRACFSSTSARNILGGCVRPENSTFPAIRSPSSMGEATNLRSAEIV